MTQKEIVLRAIERKSPPRLPLYFQNRDFECSDIADVGAGPAMGFKPAQPGRTEWGYRWHSFDKTMGQPEDPPLADGSSLDTYVPPDAHAPGRFEGLKEKTDKEKNRFIRFGIGISGFNQATFLRGFENYLEDLYTEPERAEKVLDIVFKFENGLIEQACRYPIDCVSFGDDWGTQRGLMISPDLWRKMFKPRYAEQFARVRRSGKKVWMHSCGDIRDIIGDFIEIGVDVLELLQPDIFGVEWLARNYGEKICFCCSVDHQRRAISGTRDEIFDYVKLLNDNLGRFKGGFIGYIEDYACLGMSEQNYQWIKQAFREEACEKPG
jgi:hypothetical protein